MEKNIYVYLQIYLPAERIAKGAGENNKYRSGSSWGGWSNSSDSKSFNHEDFIFFRHHNFKRVTGGKNVQIKLGTLENEAAFQVPSGTG